MKANSIAQLALAVLASPGEAAAAPCQQSCAELSSTFGTALFYPRNDTTQFWDQKQQLAGQICRVEPSAPEDVAKTLAIVIMNACPFAIKGGGHSREVNDSNAPGGVTIDTARMRKVVPDEDDKMVVTLGAGHNLGSTLTALSSLNLSFPVGRVSSIGLGGFLLGGGQGDLGGKLGFAMDNVLEYEIVLANGTITTACPTTNPDLYWALRGGGGNNFGIVTAFKLRAVPETPIWAATTRFADNQTAAVTEELDKLVTASSADPNVNFYTDYRIAPATGEFVYTVQQRYLNATASPAAYNGLNAVPYLSRTGNLTSPNFASDVAYGVRHIFVSLSWHSSPAMLQRAASIFKTEALKVQNVSGLTAGMDSQPITLSALRIAKERGGNALGLSGDKAILENLITIAWANATDDATMYAFADAWLAKTEAASRELGVFVPYRYMNHAFRSRQDVLGSYGEENLARLRTVQRAVDPAAHLRAILSTNTTLTTVLARAAALNLPNWYLAAGAVSQTIWNHMSGLPPATGIHDYDLVYFDDTDLSWEAEDAAIQRGRALFADIPAEVEIRNQARVHLWYEAKFGAPCPRHESVEAGIDSWIATSAMIGVRVEADGEWRVYAPRGLSDFFNMVVRPNPQIGVREKYEEKARRWLGIWKELTVMPWVEKEEPLKLVS
ncbi:Bifunctional solanapyrone synthase [Colletotrichum fructicola]|nr:Bifunctional solanapyrone synthase [Colletotrichum fructicola]